MIKKQKKNRSHVLNIETQNSDENVVISKQETLSEYLLNKELPHKKPRIKVSDDDLGNKYEEGLKKENVKYFYSKKKESIPTGTCLILVTPDSERTMVTFLGTAGKINDNDINASAVKN